MVSEKERFWGLIRFSFCVNFGVFVDRRFLLVRTILPDGWNGVNVYPGKEI